MRIAIATVLCAAAAASSMPAGSISFESDGVKVGGTLIKGKVLEVRDSVLVSGSVVEPLSNEIEISLGSNKSLVLEPGLRLSRDNKGYLLTAHGRRFVSLNESVEMETPFAIAVSTDGWKVGDKSVSGDTMRAKLVASAPAMTAVASVPQTQPLPRRPVRKAKSRFVFSEHPWAGNQTSESHTIRSVPNISPSGL
jgi:hypothetical protein